MSNQEVITLDEEPDEVEFLTTVTKVQSDCIFIEAVQARPSAPTSAIPNASTGPANRNKRPKREPKEQKLPLKKTEDASTSTSDHETESPLPAANGISCVVCQEQKSATVNAFVSTNCGHVYCTGCIAAILNTTKCCAICRKKLTKRMYHRIFF